MIRNRAATLVLFLFALGVALVAVPRSRADADAFSLTVQTVGNGSVAVTPDPPYSNGQQVTLTATPDAGWKFQGWTLGSDNSWGDPLRDYRVPVTVAAAGFKRADKPVEVGLKFQTLLTGLGGTTFDPNSVKVVEVDENGVVIDDAVPFQFDVRRDYTKNWKGTGACYSQVTGEGAVVWIMEGNTAAGAQRYYHIYFDQLGKGIVAPTVTQQVKVTDNVMDEGQAGFKVETPMGDYLYHKNGGGFSSFDDVDGNDWISYSKEADAAGAFRGIPNMVHPNNGGFFHPGHTGVSTCLLSQGPIKATIFSNVYKFGNNWTATWEFYPDYVDNTVYSAIYNYYWLYEGTPGGKLDMDSDYFVFADGTVVPANKEYEKDMPADEWAYAVDPALSRSLFMIKHQPDDKIDSYRDLDQVMTVLAFGRNLASTQFLDKTAVPANYSFGLMDTVDQTAGADHINGVYKPMTVTSGQAQKKTGTSLGSANPLQFTITGEHTITATFVPDEYTLTVTTEGSGSVTKSPDKQKYAFNEEVTLTATPQPGWSFVEWQGDLTGTTNPVKVNMTASKTIKAVFSTSFTVTTSVTGQGSVTVEPNLPVYAPGTVITVTAVPAPGWSFSNWSGDLTGTQNPTSKVVNSSQFITANFTGGTFTLDVNDDGNGSADWTPKKNPYDAGDVITLTATPDPGFAFAGWQGTLTGTDNPATLTMTQNSVVTATFAAANTLTVNIDPAGKGTVAKSPDKPGYGPGEVVTLTATALPGWIFKSWSGDLSGATNPAQVTMTSNKVVTATFEQTAYVVNVTVAGQGTVTKDPDQPTYAKNETVTLTATPATGWTFERWSGGASGSTNPLTLTITADKNITAVFSQPGVLESDAFDRCELGNQWQFVNPKGDGSVTLDGTKLKINVPATDSHNLWSDDKSAPRIMQPANDVDFEVRVKFDSAVTTAYQMQGIIIEQDADDFLRFEFQASPTGPVLYIGSVTAGAGAKVFQAAIAPATSMEMSVLRNGDKFVVSYRLNGAATWVKAKTFTQTPFDVTQVGVFAGNVKKSGVTPAHQAVVDYFYNVQDGQVPTDKSLLSLSVVGQGQVQRNPAAPTYACGTAVTLTPKPSAGWQFSGWSGDLGGSQSPVTVTLNGPKAITATFTESNVETYTLYLPVGIK